MLDRSKLKLALKNAHPEVWLRENCGISRGEARREIEEYKIQRKASWKKLFRKAVFGMFAAAALATGFGVNYSSYLSERREEKEANEARRRISNVEQIINDRGRIDFVENACGQGGNIYLIGQLHSSKKFDSSGPVEDYHITPGVVPSQNDIFFMIRDLSDKTGLRLVIGEGTPITGLVQRKDARDPYVRRDMENSDLAVKKFFSMNPTETAYTVLGRFFPEKIQVYGSDDIEYIEKTNEFFRKIGERNKEFNLGDVGELARVDPVTLELVRKDCDLSDERSVRYLNDGLKTADKLGPRDFAIVIGMAHIPMIAKVYGEMFNNNPSARRMYVIIPRSAQYEGIDYSKPNTFEGFLKYYKFDKPK